MISEENRRILLIDDNASIHEDFKKILCNSGESSTLSDAKAAFFGDTNAEPVVSGPSFEIESGFQGKEGLELLEKSIRENRPFAMAFVDVRMPPGWDGIETIEQLWKVDPELQVVICTAFADYSWDEMIKKLGQSDRLLILKKPFDPIEISQLASAFTAKWNAARREQTLIADLTAAEQRARAYASSLKTVNSHLETAKAAADKSSELKTEFLVHLSAEIHNNLNAILGRIDMLSEPQGASPQEVEHLGVILGASHHLITSLDQILDITMMESGQLQVKIGPCSPLEIVNEVIAEVRPFADAKNLPLEMVVKSPVPSIIQSDPARLKQIISNLVENAVRFTDEGSVRVELGTEHTDNWKRQLFRCAVVDTGVGIPFENQGSLYEPFFRLHDPKEGEACGTGLGLTLSKRLARLMSADLSVESTPGVGSTFTLTTEAGDLAGVKMIDSQGH